MRKHGVPQGPQHSPHPEHIQQTHLLSGEESDTVTEENYHLLLSQNHIFSEVSAFMGFY